jgi:hypothetical protein
MIGEVQHLGRSVATRSRLVAAKATACGSAYASCLIEMETAGTTHVRKVDENEATFDHGAASLRLPINPCEAAFAPRRRPLTVWVALDRQLEV